MPTKFDRNGAEDSVIRVSCLTSVIRISVVCFMFDRVKTAGHWQMCLNEHHGSVFQVRHAGLNYVVLVM